MISSVPRHRWIRTPATPPAPPGGDGRQTPPGSRVEVRCHRRLRGPYTGGRYLLHTIVPGLAEEDASLLTAKATEILTIAPELEPLVPDAPRTLTTLAAPGERTRFYPSVRTVRLSHGVAELFMSWATRQHRSGLVLAFHELDHADPTDHELVSILLRRCDPELAVIEAYADDALGSPLGAALTQYADQSQGRPSPPRQWPAGADLAQAYLDSEGISPDPALEQAYLALSPAERARRHTARMTELAAHGEPGAELGAVLYHAEHGTDPVNAGGKAFNEALEYCFNQGFYGAALHIALRGRKLSSAASRPASYWNFTHKAAACLSYLQEGADAIRYLAEIRAGTTDPSQHMNCCYMMAMQYTRHLAPDEHDQEEAMGWVNTAIVIADRNPDPQKRVFTGAFMRNARALVELHRGDAAAALALVNEAIGMTDAELGHDAHLLHRSVLVYNRAQILARTGDPAGSLLDYDEVIRRDPDYGDYYFERAGVNRALGRFAEALADYGEAIRLSPPFHEAHFNRADLLRELGDAEGALRDLDYAAILDPDHLETQVNRADLLLELGELERARADIDRGLAQYPQSASLLSARGLVLAESGDTAGAAASYTAALQADPGYVAAWVNRAILHHTSGRPADAVHDLDQAIGLADDPALRANRAIALQDLAEHQRALDDLDLAIAALGEDLDPDLLYRRGASRHALGDTDGAAADWRAHLAAYDPPQASPFARQIERYHPDLTALAQQLSESAA